MKPKSKPSPHARRAAAGIVRREMTGPRVVCEGLDALAASWGVSVSDALCELVVQAIERRAALSKRPLPPLKNLDAARQQVFEFMRTLDDVETALTAFVHAVETSETKGENR